MSSDLQVPRQTEIPQICVSPWSAGVVASHCAVSCPSKCLKIGIGNDGPEETRLRASVNGFRGRPCPQRTQESGGDIESTLMRRG